MSQASSGGRDRAQRDKEFFPAAGGRVARAKSPAKGRMARAKAGEQGKRAGKEKGVLADSLLSTILKASSSDEEADGGGGKAVSPAKAALGSGEGPI